MSGWTYPRAGVAPAVGDAVGAGVQTFVQAYAGWAAENSTNAAMRATPATAARATIAVRYRSRNDRLWTTLARSRRPARAEPLAPVEGRVVRAAEDGRVGRCRGSRRGRPGGAGGRRPFRRSRPRRRGPAFVAAAFVAAAPAPAAPAVAPVTGRPALGDEAGVAPVCEAELGGLALELGDDPAGRAFGGWVPGRCRRRFALVTWLPRCWDVGVSGTGARHDRAVARRPKPAQRERIVARPGRPREHGHRGARRHHEAVPAWLRQL